MRYETSMMINRPIEEVWAFLSDPFNAPRYSPSALRLRQTSPGPIGVGTTGHMRVMILGFETGVSLTVTEWDPPHAFAWAWKTTLMRSNYDRLTLDVTADGTKVVRVFEFEPGPILKLLLPIFGPYFRRRIDTHNQNLKRVLEAGRG